MNVVAPPKEAHLDLGCALNHMLIWLPPEHDRADPLGTWRLCRGDEWWKIERKRVAAANVRQRRPRERAGIGHPRFFRFELSRSHHNPLRAMAWACSSVPPVAIPRTAAEVPGPVPGPMTKEYVQMMGRLAYVCGRPAGALTG
jgi:hypothetical protein